MHVLVAYRHPQAYYRPPSPPLPLLASQLGIPQYILVLMKSINVAALRPAGPIAENTPVNSLQCGRRHQHAPAPAPAQAPALPGIITTKVAYGCKLLLQLSRSGGQ